MRIRVVTHAVDEKTGGIPRRRLYPDRGVVLDDHHIVRSEESSVNSYVNANEAPTGMANGTPMPIDRDWR